MPTLQTVAIVSNTYNNITLFITFMQIYTPIDKLIEDAIYIERKNVSL